MVDVTAGFFIGLLLGLLFLGLGALYTYPRTPPERMNTLTCWSERIGRLSLRVGKWITWFCGPCLVISFVILLFVGTDKS